MPTPNPQQTQSTIHRPGRGIVLAAGILFTLVGGSGLLAGFVALQGNDLGVWIVRGMAAVFTLMGCVALTAGLRMKADDARVQHAAATVMQDAPSEPVILDGLIVHGRLTHELKDTAREWQFAPKDSLWRNDKRFLLGFGIPFTVGFAGLASWILHSQGFIASLPLAIVVATLATVLCGGSAIAIIALVRAAGYRRLCRLTIPYRGGDLELATPKSTLADARNQAEGLSMLLGGKVEFDRRKIPAERVTAVQLCPWRYVVSGAGRRSSTDAVQGVLVLSGEDEALYERLPIMLTSDFAGAADLMAKLAGVLNVPFLYHADSGGWSEERQRAKDRPPLQVGGISG